jgi:thiamine kinase-like enzyme
VNAGTDPATVLAAIPGWRGASFRELPGGLTNRTLFVEKDGRRAVLKIDPAPRMPPYNPRRDEAGIQERAAAIGRANGVLYVDDTVLLAEWADGEVWTRDHFDEDDNLGFLAHALRAVHGLPLTGRVFDLQAAAHQYVGQLNEADLDGAEPHIGLIESMPGPANLCCCHNDLVAENILSTPRVRFLDWEYACDNDPLFDLGVVVAHHGLSDRQAGVLLDAYFNGDGSPWREQLATQMRLYDALNWLWTAANAFPAQDE